MARDEDQDDKPYEILNKKIDALDRALSLSFRATFWLICVFFMAFIAYTNYVHPRWMIKMFTDSL